MEFYCTLKTIRYVWPSKWSTSFWLTEIPFGINSNCSFLRISNRVCGTTPPPYALSSNFEELELVVYLEISLHSWGGELDSKVQYKRRERISGFMFCSRHLTGNVDNCRTTQVQTNQKICMLLSIVTQNTNRHHDLRTCSVTTRAIWKVVWC